MSQHCFYTSLDDEPTKILMGWDRPMQGFFLVIEKESDKSKDLLFWSNLDQERDEDVHPKSLDIFIGVLASFNIQIPIQMLGAIIKDKKINAGNKCVKHSFIDGVYFSEIC